MVLLQVSFAFAGPFGLQMAEPLKDLAASINEEPGFIRKYWTEDAAAGVAGGVYLFKDKACAQAYLDKHRARLADMGVSEVNARLFDVNPTLSAMNGADVS